jgi:PTH2 family peptidyl-tRNA hydrolase
MSTSTQLDRLPPTTTAYVIATAILAGVTGYFIGQGASLGLLSSSERKSWPNSYDVRVHRDSSDEDEDEEDETDSEDEDEGDGGELASFKDNVDEVKLVLVVRTDLGMTKGSFCPRSYPINFCRLIANERPWIQAKSPRNARTPR